MSGNIDVAFARSRRAIEGEPARSIHTSVRSTIDHDNAVCMSGCKMRSGTMSRTRRRHRQADGFDVVRAIGLTLPDVTAGTKYDGSPVLKIAGCFMAGLAMDPSAEPGTLVVRADPDEREWLLADAPHIYYLTEYHRRHPVVLARLSRLDRDALRDLLSMSRRLTLLKATSSRRYRPSSGRGRRAADSSRADRP